MAKPEARPYNSPVRRRQADATRRKILDAARELLATHGYEDTTIDAIARAAGVATPTVYAAFGAKRAIVAELMDDARFGPAYEAAVSEAMTAKRPAQRLALAARIARTVYAAEVAEQGVLRGVAAVAPELAELEREREGERREAQRLLVEGLASAGKLREGLTLAAARDVLWAMTTRELYRLLVRERGWTPDRYEQWLAGMLVEGLLRPGARAMTGRTTKGEATTGRAKEARRAKK